MSHILKLFKSLFYVFIIGAVWNKPLFAQIDSFELLEITSNRMILALKSFEIEVSPLRLENKFYQQITIADFGVSTRPGFPELPTTGALIPVPLTGRVNITILESTFEDIPEVSVPPVPDMQIDYQSGQVSSKYKKDVVFYSTDTFWPGKQVEFTNRSQLRGQPIGRIQVNPVQYNPVQRVLRIYKTLKVQVTFDEPLKTGKKNAIRKKGLFNDFSRRLLLSPHFELSDYVTRLDLKTQLHVNDWYNPQFNYFKLFIEEEGIYELTFDDLVQMGAQPELLDLNRVKIYNQGNQVPVWIAGPQSGTFTRDNKMYFYGDWYRGSETYFDFYTNTNIYWLTADGGAGRRYQTVEESVLPGSPESYFWENLHIEKEKIFHRSNGSSAIDQDEAWIWRFLFDDDRETIIFELTGLSESVPECSLKIRLHGTTIDPINPDHHVRLSINEKIVGETFFDGQEELIWQVSFPTEFLQEGENKIDLHLVADTGAQLNQIYLDWLEIIYPRAHVALQNNMKFQETNPAGGLSEYTLVNFKDRGISIFEPAGDRMWRPETRKISFVQVESAGFDDGKFAKMTLDFETVHFTILRRGHNLVVIDPKSGNREVRIFDTFVSPDSANAMAEYINSLPDSTIVLAAIVDEGSLSMTENAHQALESLGSALTRQVQERDSWALVGWKGAVIGSVKETLSRNLQGPAIVSDTLREAFGLRFSATFKDTTSITRSYHAISNQGFKKVKVVEKEQSSDLLASTHGADYIIITHEKFKEQAKRLANYRSQQNGFRVMIVDVQDIYDELNAGIMNPRAIKDFLTHAFVNWQKPAPSYVLLFGDASWDPKLLSSTSVKINYVPSYGILVSDNWFVSLDGPDDFLPDMFIGRIPVETPEQAAIVVDKIIAYESLDFDAWNKEFILLNGGIGRVEQSIFLLQAEKLVAEYIEAFPFHGRTFEFNKTSDEAITRSFWPFVADKIKNGVMWVNFLGHASSTVWDIDIRQPEDWQNTKVFPFMTGMSCHSARHANPVLNSLSENYFINPIGASGYWGSSGFGYITQDFFLLEGLFNAIAQDTVRSIGMATTLAKWHLWQKLGDQSRNRYVIEQYTLIGDPAMTLVIPEKPELTVMPEDIQFESDLLLISDSTTVISVKIQNFGLLPKDSVDVQLTVFDEDNKLFLFSPGKTKPFGNVDSLAFLWKLPEIPGPYRIQVEVDPANIIEEESEANNVVENTVFIFSSDLTVIKPFEFGIVDMLRHSFRVCCINKSIEARLGYKFSICFIKHGQVMTPFIFIEKLIVSP